MAARLRSQRVHAAAWFAIVCSFFFHAAQAIKYAPNHFLGTCLTDDWVASMEKTRGINSRDRDPKGRLMHPFLHTALKHRLRRIDDPRLATTQAYSPACVPPAAVLWGVDSVVNETTGTVQDQGWINGSLVIERFDWTSHDITSVVFSTIAAEVYGYQVANYSPAGDATLATQRMGSVLTGQCTPTHANLEIWGVGYQNMLDLFLNESFAAGGTGYNGLSGLYTTTDFVNEFVDTSKHMPPLYADYWRGFKYDEELIKAVPVSTLWNNSVFFPPATVGCADGKLGCLNHCSKSAACTDREAQGKECMVVALMFGNYDSGYIQAVMTNIGIPAYFCFLGYGGMLKYVIWAQENKQPVLFYHYEPDLFHAAHPGLFQRFYLPRSQPERAILSTGTFGENGYGKPTTNPVDVDFPSLRLTKYAAGVLREQQPIGSFVTKFSISELHINDLMRKFDVAGKDPTEPDPTFRAACNWVKANYDVWTGWLDRAPLCSLSEHAHYEVTGCDDHDPSNSTSSRHRVISFTWNLANPDNTSLPFDCDGGIRELPEPIKTSRSCEWIRADQSKWASWVHAKPACDATFYKYNITGCDAHAQRTVKYWWLLADDKDITKSLECQGSVALPKDVKVDCEYMPTTAPASVVLAVIAAIMIVLHVLAIGFVIHNRSVPIIKRSQFEFLVIMIVGGIMICIAAVLYAGEPTMFRCGARPVFVSSGFTIIFGALLVKSLRVYRVFMKTTLKKATVSTALMAKVLAILCCVDVLIISVWFIVDFPEPVVTIAPSRDFTGDIDRIACQSSSFIFTALLMFWKAIVLAMGLYACFLIRHVSSDFQESVWMCASSLIVLVGCLVLLPLAYLVEMPASAFYIFLAGCLLVCTLLVMMFMLGPKIYRLGAVSSSSASHHEGSKPGSSAVVASKYESSTQRGSVVQAGG